MYFLKSLLVLLLIIPTLSMSTVAQKIDKGQPAPFNGVIITEEKAVELYKAEKKVIVLEDLRLTEKELSEVYLKKTKDLSLKLNRSESELFWYKVGIGVLVGAFVYRGVTK